MLFLSLSLFLYFFHFIRFLSLLFPRRVCEQKRNKSKTAKTIKDNSDASILVYTMFQEKWSPVRHDRAAPPQLLVLPVHTVEVEEAEALPASARGADGFGSTGR